MEWSDVKIFEAAPGIRSGRSIAEMKFEANPEKITVRVDFEAGAPVAGAGQTGEHPVPGSVCRARRHRHCLQHERGLDEDSQGLAAADR